MKNNFSEPVLLCLYNRPEKTKKVFHAIRQIRPDRLYIAADGPNSTKEDDWEKCNKCRNIIENIDWKCSVFRLFHEKNLGCKKAIISAINWFFENEKQGIILEDDCLPEISFFRYCEELLNYYQNEEKIMHIGGSNFQKGYRRGIGSYYFSNIIHVWGWATWRRAWNKYAYTDYDSDSAINTVFDNRYWRRYWIQEMKKAFEGKIDTWDYQWVYTIWKNKGMGITPNVNMVKNIGFDSDGTHTNAFEEKKLTAIVQNIEFPLIHPEYVCYDRMADKYTMKTHYGLSGINYIKNYLKKYIFKHVNPAKYSANIVD